MPRPTLAVPIPLVLLLSCTPGELPPLPVPRGDAVAALPPAPPSALARSFLLRSGPVLAIRAETTGEESAPRAPLTLAFPVADHDAGAIRGKFGDERAGGRRAHDGIDIFASRGTPVLAAATAVVSRVETDRTGGRVIWAQDEARNLSYFYAHLERQLVERGAPITAGDTIGTVGNSGNARGSSPHLHFAIYRPGMVPIDPVPFLAGADGAGGEDGADGAAGAAGALSGSPADSDAAGPGSWARTRTGAVRLRASPARSARIVSQLGRGTVVRLVGAVEEWRQVRLADGTAGYVASWLLEPLAGSY